jgi:hypothetical protein
MSESYVVVTNGIGTTYSGPDATNLYRAIALRASINLYLKTGMIPTRGITITRMLQLAKTYTGKTYKRGQGGVAVADLITWIDAMKAAIPIIDSTKNTPSI